MAAAALERNWSGTYRYRAATVHHPTDRDELRSLVAAAPRLHALGSRHSFTAIADAGELVALDRLGEEIEFDQEEGTVWVPAAATYAALAPALNHEGRALANMASLPHISVAGAIATATHGSGERLGNLATAVAGVELITSTGDLLTVGEGDPDFRGLVVGLGALGVVTRVRLRTQPFYEASQRVYEGMEWEAVFAHFDELQAAGDSVSIFHLADAHRTEQVWVKRREPAEAPHPAALFGAPAATAAVHPILGGDPVNCTAQLGEVGPWSERLPHFRSGFMPSAGEEIQSEAFVPRADAVAAIQAVLELGEELRPLLLISELRTIAADALWLSPHSGRDTLALHFTWRRRPEAVERAVARVEAALGSFGVRSHWGKVTSLRAADAAAQYPCLGDFLRLRAELDPRGAFVNDWLRAHLLDAP
jgi:alditol oxidase